MFWDTFVFNEKGNKLLHKVITKYAWMGYNFHFYDSKNITWQQKYQKYDGCQVSGKWECVLCLTFADERLPLSVRWRIPLDFNGRGNAIFAKCTSTSLAVLKKCRISPLSKQFPHHPDLLDGERLPVLSIQNEWQCPWISFVLNRSLSKVTRPLWKND